MPGGGHATWRRRRPARVDRRARRRLIYDSGMAPETAAPRAAILLIGNELLSGKVEDENARYLVRELRALGVAVGRVEVIPDDVDEIADTTRKLSARFELVFSSG